MSNNATKLNVTAHSSLSSTMNDQILAQDRAAIVPLVRRALRTSIILISFATLLTGCGAGGGSDTASTNDSALLALAEVNAVKQPVIVPPDATFRGQTYAGWATSFWQWALALPLSNPPHPFNDCTNRPISAALTGDVWYWSAPDLAPDGTPLVCNQSATIIPAGKAIFLTIRDVEASSLDDPPFNATTAAGQQAIAQLFFSRIINVFCTIDDVPVDNLQAYHFLTSQF